MSELERIIFETNKLKKDGIDAINILRTNNINPSYKNHALTVFKNIERFLSDRKLVDFVYRQDRRLCNEIMQIYEELKRRVRNLEDLTHHINQDIERRIDTFNGLLVALRKLFNYDLSKVNNLNDRLNKISIVLNDNKFDLNNVSKELYNQYMQTKQTLLRIYETFKEYISFLNYIKAAYNKYQEIANENEKNNLLRQILNSYQFLQNKLSALGIDANLNNLNEIQFFISEYKKIVKEPEIKPKETLIQEDIDEVEQQKATVSIEQLGISRRTLQELEGFYTRYALYLKKPYKRDQQIFYLKEFATLLENSQLYEIIENIDVTNLNEKDLKVIVKIQELIEDIKEMDLYPKKMTGGK